MFAEDKESKVIAENKVSKVVTEKIERISDSGNYPIQLLSLSDYSDIRVMDFLLNIS